VLGAAAKDPDRNLMPFIIDAVKDYASLGEICNVLRAEFGEYQESIVL
jgi:methylmalonyl-CoA mutase N-terminal domain/subunit